MKTQTSDFEGLEADIFRARASSNALKNLLSDRSQVSFFVSLCFSRETSLARVSPCERKSERERKCVRDG